MPPSSPTSAPEPAPSDEDAPILALERFAALSADIEAGGARDEVIAREGLSASAWTRAQESWLGKMAEEAARKRFDLTNRYNTAFVAQRRSHDGGGRRTSKKRKGARGDVVNVAPASPPLVSSPPPLASAPAFVAPAAAPFVAPAPSFVAPPPRVSAPPFVAAPAPVASSSPSTVAVPAYVEPPAAAPLPQRLGETSAARRSPFAGDAALPFVKSALPFEAAEKSRSSALPPATPFERPSAHPAPAAKFDPNAVMDLSGTVSAEMLSPVEINASLPFRGAGASARPPPPAPPPPGASLQNLPFRAAASAAKAPAAPAAPAAHGASAVHAAPAAPAAHGASATHTAPAAHGAPAAPAAARAVRFTLEQFTSLSAEIAIAPASVAQVRGRYGLDEASHRAEAEEWGRRFAADKELFARYSALFQSYRDWLARSAR